MDQDQLSQNKVNILYSSIIRSFPGLENAPPWLKDSEEFWNKYSKGEISFQKTEGPYRIARYTIIEDETGFNHYKFDDWGDRQFLENIFLSDTKSIKTKVELRSLKSKWNTECRELIGLTEKPTTQPKSMIEARLEIEDFQKWISNYRLSKEDLSDLFNGNIEKAQEVRNFFKPRYTKDGKWTLTPKVTAHLIAVLINKNVLSEFTFESLHRILINEFGYSHKKSNHLKLQDYDSRYKQELYDDFAKELNPLLNKLSKL